MDIKGLQQVKEYHVEAAKRLLSYAQDADMRKSDSEHYRKRAAFHAGLVDILDVAIGGEKMVNIKDPVDITFGGSPPGNCRQRLMREGKPYHRSSCAACGKFSPKWRECDARLGKPSVGGEK